MQSLQTGLFYLLAFIFAFSLLVLFHELGHYLAARACGVKVLRFSLGMGRVLFARKLGADQTEWALSQWPLGGYVKLLDARDPEQQILPQDAGREFTAKPVGSRMFILAAGPAASFLLAILLFWFLNLVGTQEPGTLLRQVAPNTAAAQAGLEGGERVLRVDDQDVRSWSALRKQIMLAVLERKLIVLEVARLGVDGLPLDARRVQLDPGAISAADLEQGDFMSKLGLEMARKPARLDTVEPGGAGAKAGLQSGDVVLQVDAQPVPDGMRLVQLVRNAPGRELLLQVQRGGQTLEVRATPVAQTDAKGSSIGRLQIGLDPAPRDMQLLRYGLFEGLYLACAETWDMSIMSLKMLGKMLTGQLSWRNLTGPITIADYAGQTASISWQAYLHFIGFISLSVGVMNLLPVPMLDGGYLLYYSLELLRGRPLPENIIEFAQRAGFCILIGMMFLALINDVARHLA
ncbi:RIP metalloprotease RseP [Massilia sp. W12]|uniref:RIP metalloprotease RseP n=1 Tax=Massilia sp. W12 TaxID=3126507 RepID=UPI0030D572E7